MTRVAYRYFLYRYKSTGINTDKIYRICAVTVGIPVQNFNEFYCIDTNKKEKNSEKFISFKIKIFFIF